MPIKNSASGIILIDILLALSLAVLFIAVITESSLGASDLFYRARERMALMDAYESKKGLELETVEYGNERLQDVFTVSSQGIATASPYYGSIAFEGIRADPSVPLGDAIGAPLCSPDLTNKDVVGSYSFIADEDGVDKADPAVASITPIILPISPSLPLTGLQVRDGIAYISTDSSVASDPDILIADIHDPAHPMIRSSINTGPGIASIALAGKTIFAAADSTAAQLHVIGMNGLDSLVLEKKYKLPLPYATATPAVATAISYSDSKIYLGTDKWDGDEFSVIDVSNPLQPVKVGGLEVGAQVNDIVVRNHIAYVASAAQQQILAVDVSDPSAPTVIALFSPSGWQRQEGKAISSFEGALNVGRTSGGYDIVQDRELFSWATSSLMASAVPASLDIPGGIYGIVTDKHHIYAATRTVNQEFSIFDSTLSSSTPVSYPLPVAPQMMTCDGDRLYVLAATAPAIYQITFK